MRAETIVELRRYVHAIDMVLLREIEFQKGQEKPKHSEPQDEAMKYAGAKSDG